MTLKKSLLKNLKLGEPFPIFNKIKAFAAAVTESDPVTDMFILNNASAAVTLSASALYNGKLYAVHSTLDAASILAPSGWTFVLYNGGTLDANNSGLTGGAGTNGWHCFFIPDEINKKLYVFAPDNVIGVA